MRYLRERTPDLLIILLFFVLPLGFFWPQTLGGRTLIPTENLYQSEPFATYREVVQAPAVPHNGLVSDLVLENLQWKAFARTQFEQGEIPLWNPHQFSGIPFLAAGQHSMLYPLSVLYLVLDLPVAYGWYTVLNLWLAGLMMFAFVRGLGVGRGGAVVAGIIYQFNGFILASVVFQMMVGAYPWLPLLLLMVEWVIRRRPLGAFASPLPWVGLGGIALGLNILAGHAEILLYTLLIAGYFAAGRLLYEGWRTRDWAMAVRTGLLLVAMIALGFALGAVQFVPLFEFVQTNWRAERSDLATVLGYAHPLRDVIQFFVPNFYGSPAHHQYFDLFSGQMITAFTNRAGEPITVIDWGIKNYVESALYLGILPLALAGYALVDRWWLWPRATGRIAEPPYRGLFSLLGGLGLTFMFGLPTYALIYALPGFNQLNSPFRWILAVTIVVAVLAAFGADALLRRASAHPRAVRVVAIGLMSLGGLVLAGLIAAFVFFSALVPILERLIDNLARAGDAFSDAQMFLSYQAPHILALALALLASGLVFWVARRARDETGRRRWALLAVAVITADLMFASWGFNPASDPALLDFTPPEVQLLLDLQAEGEPFRYTTLEAGPAILNANSGWRYGLDDIRGYDSIIGAQYVAYMRALAPQGQLDFNRIAPFFAVDLQRGDALTNPALLDLLNVRYIYAQNDVYVPPAWREVQRFPSITLWENPTALPRAFTVAEAAFDPDWLADEPDLVTLAAPAEWHPARILSDSGREKFIRVDQPSAVYLVVSETYDPGWRAFIRPVDSADADEVALPVVRVLGNFLAVSLPGGDWTVRLIYSPTSFQVGLFGTIIGTAILTLMAGMWFWGAYVGARGPAITTSGRIMRNSLVPILLNLFNRGIDFALLLVILRVLTPEEVGIYYYLVVIFVWFDIFTNFGLDLYLIREVARDPAQAGHAFYNTTLLRLALSVVGVALVVGFVAIRQATVSPPLDEPALLALALLYAGLFPASLSKGMSSVFYAFEQAEKPEAIATITTINKAIFNVIVLLLGYGIVGLAGVSIVNNFITLGVLAWTGRRLLGRIVLTRPDWGLLRRMSGASVPLMLNHFLATIFFQIDVVILEGLRGAVTVAQYSVAYRWILAINVVPALFTRALLPMMSRQSQEDVEALRRTVTFGLKLLFILALPLAVFFTLLAVPLTYLMGGEQYLPDGAIAIQLMIWSIPIGWMNSLLQYVLVALDLQRQITVAFVVAVTFNITTNLIFIPLYGYQAAAITTIFSELVLFVPFFWLAQRRWQGGIADLYFLWRPVVAGGAMLAVSLLAAPLSLLLGVGLGGAIYAMVLLSLRPFSAQELALLPGRLTHSRMGRVLLRPAPGM